jgi:Asp-tRNA(Asn)/Glu-tRNA(Gln) amidotransferase A subunit family amidase
MVAAALGTQTGGSILRPASFCGVFGYKPTYNTINKAGTWPAADSIDTIGWLARSVDDCALLTAVLRMETPKPPAELGTPPRIGVWRTDLWDTTQQETKDAVEQVAKGLAKAGADVRDIELPAAFTGVHVIARSTVGFYERAACMASAWDRQRELLSPQIRTYIENGHKISRDEYVAGMKKLDECRVLLRSLFENVDVLLVPCVPGEAPQGLAATGDPRLQSIWTALHTPSMTLPTHRGPNNLPVGIQLVGQRYEDDHLFACARWVWDAIGDEGMVGVQQ